MVAFELARACHKPVKELVCGKLNVDSSRHNLVLEGSSGESRVMDLPVFGVEYRSLVLRMTAPLS